MKSIKERAEEYAAIKSPLRVKDYSASTKRIYNAYIAGANEYESLVKANKELLEALKEIVEVAEVLQEIGNTTVCDTNVKKAIEAIKKHSPIN